MSALDNLGPHLLGRIPSPIDLRDFRVEDHLDGALSPAQQIALLDLGVAHLKQTTVGWLEGHPPHPHSTTWQNDPTTQWWQGLNPIAQVRASLGGSPPPPPPPTGDVKYADPSKVLDQGQKGTCVGNGTSQLLNTDPINDAYSEGDGSLAQSALKGGPFARAVYYEATVFDGQGDNPDSATGGQQGASVRSGMKALAARGRIGGYAVTQDVATVRAWLQSGKGGVVIGIGWTNSMFTPDASGYIYPVGADVGGHCLLIAGDLVSESAAWILNSWSAGWGLGGYCKMKWTDVQARLTANGEAWTAVELPL